MVSRTRVKVVVVCLQSGDVTPDTESAKHDKKKAFRNGAGGVAHDYSAYEKPSMAAHSDSLIMAYSNPAMDLSSDREENRRSYEMLTVSGSMRAKPNSTPQTPNKQQSPKHAAVRVITVETHSGGDNSSLNDDVTSFVANQDSLKLSNSKKNTSAAATDSNAPSSDAVGQSDHVTKESDDNLSVPVYDNQAFLSDSGCDANSDVTPDEAVVNEEDEVTSL